MPSVPLYRWGPRNEQKQRAIQLAYPSQCVPDTQIDVEKLQNLLYTEFGTDFLVRVTDDVLTIYFPILLSRAEINACG